MLRHKSHFISILQPYRTKKAREVTLPSNIPIGSCRLSILSRIMFSLASEQIRAKNSTNSIAARMMAESCWVRGRPLVLATSSSNLRRKSLSRPSRLKIIIISRPRLALQQATTSLPKPKPTIILPWTKFKCLFKTRLPKRLSFRTRSCLREPSNRDIGNITSRCRHESSLPKLKSTWWNSAPPINNLSFQVGLSVKEAKASSPALTNRSPNSRPSSREETSTKRRVPCNLTPKSRLWIPPNAIRRTLDSAANRVKVSNYE